MSEAQERPQFALRDYHFSQFPAKYGKTNLSHDGLNPAHVPCQWVNNPTLSVFCGARLGRADIEGSKSDVAMNAWPPQASYPCGNYSDTSGLICSNIIYFSKDRWPCFRSLDSYWKSLIKQAFTLVFYVRFLFPLSSP